MPPRKTIIALLATLSAALALADDFKTSDGKEYKNATVRRVEADGIVISSKGGISKLYFTELPKDVQERFHYDPELAAANAAQAAAAQQAEEFIKQQKEQQTRAGGTSSQPTEHPSAKRVSEAVATEDDFTGRNRTGKECTRNCTAKPALPALLPASAPAEHRRGGG